MGLTPPCFIPQICNIMNTAADETFEFQVRDLEWWREIKNKNHKGLQTLFWLCFNADWTTRQQWLDHKKCSLAANRQQKGRDSWCGHFLQQKRWKAFWWSGRAAHGGTLITHSSHEIPSRSHRLCFGVCSSSWYDVVRSSKQRSDPNPCSSGFDPVPWLVRFEHGHLWQDEQAGESEGHCSRHGALPRQMSGWWDSEYPGQYWQRKQTCFLYECFTVPGSYLKTYNIVGSLTSSRTPERSTAVNPGSVKRRSS